jgi:hypothetical protein
MIRYGSHLSRSLPRQSTASARLLSVVGNGLQAVLQPHSTQTQTRWLSSQFKSSSSFLNANIIQTENRLSMSFSNSMIRFKSTVAVATSQSQEPSTSTATTSSPTSYTPARRSGVRNVAIIAHVDHGKTTLVDQLLRASSTNSTDNSSTNANASTSVDRLLDSGDLEKERGITITSKVTRCQYDDTIFNGKFFSLLFLSFFMGFSLSV